MMKYRLLILFILISALFSACSENKLSLDNLMDRQEILLEANIDQQYATRVNDTGFTEGDAIGVYVVDYHDGNPGDLQSSGNHADNVKFTLTPNGWSGSSKLYWTDSRTNVDAYAYYPFIELVGDVTSVPFSVERRQGSDVEGKMNYGYEKSDFLWAKTSNAKPLGFITLHHKHIMAGVIVSLIEGEGFDGEWASIDKTVTVSNMKLDSYIDLQTGIVNVDNSVSPSTIIPYKNGNDWRCVVVPQSIDAGCELLQIGVEGNLYSFTRKSTTIFPAGKITKFAIKVDRREIGDYQFTLVSDSVETWTNDDVSHKAEAKAYITVNVPRPGGLKKAIDDLGLIYDDVINLKVTGTINNDDFLFMKESLRYIEAVNLRDVKTVDCRIDHVKESDNIPDEAFSSCATLKYIVFPDNLKKVGSFAFSRTNLCHEIIFPEGVVYVGNSAFSDIRTIPRITIPSTLKHIGDRAFSNCSINQDIILPQDLEYLGESAFESCTRITGELRIPQNIRSIKERCFCNSISLKGNLDIPSWVTEVGVGAFSCTGFNTLTLNEGLKIIRSCAFNGKSYSEASYDYFYPFGGDLVIPSSVTLIEDKAFAQTGFQHVYLPDNFEQIPEALFYDCKEMIDTMVIPSKVNHISSSAFEGCSKLTAVVLPKNLLSIGKYCFSKCYSLDYIQCLSETPPVLEGVGHFDGVAKDNFTLVVPEGCVEAYKAAPGWKEFKRISEYRNFVCRPQKARLLNNGNIREIILNADGEWSVMHCPDWAHLSQTSGKMKTSLIVTIDDLAEGRGNRTDSIVFSLSGQDYTTSYKIEQYDSMYAEDDYMTLQSASKGDGIDIIFLGDGYDAKDIADGLYLADMKQQVEYFFAVEPFKSYRDYFNVYTAFAMSYESGIGTLNTLRNVKFNTMATSSTERITTDFQSVLFYAVDNTPAEESDLDALTCVLTPNANIYDGITSMWPGKNGGAAVAVCPMSKADYPYDARGLVQHEAGGHAFGKLADEYIIHDGWLQTCSCQCCGHSEDLIQMQEMGWGMNLSLDNKYKTVPWSHFIEDNRYNDIVDIFEGGYFHLRGVYRSENNSCMNNNIPYFSTWSREIIVRRIKMLAGESFSFEDFIANDKREWGQDFLSGTRSSLQISADAPRNGVAPIMSNSEPKRPANK